MDNLFDMPKLETPFDRENESGNHLVLPKIKEDFRWVFTEEAIAVDKLDGTNVSILVRDKKVTEVYNRQNRIELFKKGTKRFAEGIYEAIEREYIKIEALPDGQYFGELIGPKLQGNPYKVDCHLWLPFDYLAGKYHYRFWPDFIKELKDKTDEEIFSAVDKLFKGLWSIYKRSRGLKGEVDENTEFSGAASEGIVFYRKGFENDYRKCCKLRRDMFVWYKGVRHGI